MGAWWGDRMDAITMRATADEGGQHEFAAAPLTSGRQPAIGNRPVAQGAAVGLIYKFDQFPPFGKRAPA